MSRPRTPFSNPPGRLPATMLKVLAAELCDPGRLSRGKRYWAENAVIDIVIGHGVVTAEVQGSRPQPYVVTIETDPGKGTPAKRDLWVQCTCPDDSLTGRDICKHAVAAMFALSDEVAVEPDLLERWRGGRRRVHAEPDTPAPPALTEPSVHEAEPTRPSVRPLRLVHSVDRPAEPAPAPPARDPSLDQIAALLAAPAGPPDFPALDRPEHRLPTDQLWARTLAGALTEFERLAWD